MTQALSYHILSDNKRTIFPDPSHVTFPTYSEWP